MGLLRLYRKFYCVSPGASGDTYTLITPTALSAEAYVAGSGDTTSTSLVETGIPLVAESTGVYYADLNPTLYSSDVTYDLVFTVQYTPSAPTDRKLTTRFRIMPFNIANQLDYEISDTTPIEYELIGIYN
jgi:hypothetical protein